MQLPNLTETEECSFVLRWREWGDRSARDKLIEAHLKLVHGIAANFCSRGVPRGDLVSEGVEALARALEGYDPSRGCRLAAYARTCIRHAMADYLKRNSRIVRPINARANAPKSLWADMSPEERAQAIAAQGLNAPIESRTDISLDAPVVTEKSDDEGSLLEHWADDAPTSEELLASREELGVRREALRAALAMLGPRDRRIFIARRLTAPPVTHEALGVELSLGRESVRQIEKRTLATVTAEVTRMVTRRRNTQANKSIPTNRGDLLVGTYAISRFLGLPCRVVRERLRNGQIEASRTPRGKVCVSADALSKFRVGSPILSGRQIENRALRAVFAA